MAPEQVQARERAPGDAFTARSRVFPASAAARCTLNRPTGSPQWAKRGVRHVGAFPAYGTPGPPPGKGDSFWQSSCALWNCGELGSTPLKLKLMPPPREFGSEKLGTP